LQNLANRALALAEHARAKPDPKRELANREPEFAAWAQPFRRVFGNTQLTYAWEHRGRVLYGAPAKGTWVRVSEPRLVPIKKGKR